MKKKICILGSTGSIGCQALDVIASFPEELELVGLSAGSNINLLKEQIQKFKPQIVSIANPELADSLQEVLQDSDAELVTGPEGLIKVATHPLADIILTSVTGTIGLLPTVEAIKAGKDIALANKETLVAAGELVMGLAREHKVRILPVDSEHSAIFQCLQGEPRPAVEKIILTASGGPFRGKTREELAQVTLEMALKHPNWDMGAKITIDSATMMNKGLEVIEAKWLYDLEPEQIQVVVHPQSIIHSMVQFQDGSVIAQIGLPDMRLPIQYAFSHPQRWKNDFPKIDFWEISQLTFSPPDLVGFPCLKLAYDSLEAGGTMTAAMNAANEKAVELFRQKLIGFTDIPKVISGVMKKHRLIEKPGLTEILSADAWAREEVLRALN